MRRSVATLGALLGGLTFVAGAAACAHQRSRAGGASAAEAESIMYPPTIRQEVIEQLHGQTIVDPYRWLEDERAPEVERWTRAQDDLTRRLLGERPERARFAARLAELLYVESTSVPVKRGARYFYSRRRPDREKAIYYWRDGVDGVERVLLDPNTLSADGSLAVGVAVPSWDGALLAYTLRQHGADAATLHVLDVASGRTLTDTLAGARYADPQWTPNGDGFYYVALPSDPSIPEDQLPGYAEIRFHRLGTPQTADPLVFPRLGDPTHFLAVQLSRDGRWLLVYDLRGWTATDIYVRDLEHPAGQFTPLVRGVDAQFSVAVWRDAFYILTTDGAPFGRVLRCDPMHRERAAWRELIPESAGATLQDFGIVGGRIVAHYLVDASSAIRLFDLDGRFERSVPLPGLGAASSVSGAEDDDEAFVGFSSTVQPEQVLRFLASDGAPTVWAQSQAPVDSTALVVERVWFNARDGARLSLFLAHRKDMRRNGDQPTVLTGYGGFNIPVRPQFSAKRFAWIERGGVYAFANLRGGGEYGEEWHRAGMRELKQNTFDDFLAAAEWLIGQRITRPERLAIEGGSNGGLLVGAALTQRPDLFRAVICAAPLLDMVRYHLFGAGRTWIDEYGSAEQPEQFKTLLAYSPYHRARRATIYPATLFLSPDHDDRVDPLHARKMTALLQDAQSGAWPILLRVERNAGHAGADLLRQTVAEWADVYAFLTWQIGPLP